MKTKSQKEWANGKYLPPKQRGYRSLYDYVSDVQRYIPNKVSQAYHESIGKRGC